MMFVWKFFRVCLFLELCHFWASWSFVKQFLLKSPKIDRTKDLWRRSEEANVAIFNNYTLSLTKSLIVPTPSYVQLLSSDLLSVTSFSLLRKGSIMQFDVKDILAPRTLKGDYLWPNELSTYQDRRGNTVMLIPDGFLMPGQSDGGIYAAVNPTSIYAKPVRITTPKDSWFYHRAIFVELPNGNQGILTARAKKPLFGEGAGELVWLSLPNSPKLDTELLPKLQETVLAQGPDVMFEVFDLDATDESIEIIAAHFFQKELSIYSLRAIDRYPYIELTKTSKIQTNGRPYGLCLASFGASLPDNNSMKSAKRKSLKNKSLPPTHLLVTTHECSYDLPSALQMIYSSVQGTYPKVKTTDIAFSDQLEYMKLSLRDENDFPNSLASSERPETGGGSLYAYEIPNITSDSMKTISNNHYELQTWKKIELFKGFKVRGWGGIFSPGAPGFPYVFHLSKNPCSPPLILIAGDCTGSAYVFTPREEEVVHNLHEKVNIPRYDLAFEIECGATVGSAAIGHTKDKSGDINLYIPAYELNKV